MKDGSDKLTLGIPGRTIQTWKNPYHKGLWCASVRFFKANESFTRHNFKREAEGLIWALYEVSEPEDRDWET